jgi:2'-hydroxyisoflavone reductase
LLGLKKMLLSAFSNSTEPMKLLILGGTRFVGRHITEAALRRGHAVTLFNRGQTAPELFPDADSLVGDRDGNLEPLRGRRWDAAIDVNGYLPRIVRASAELLADSVSQYAFISTISVFADFSQPGLNESSPLADLEDESVEEINNETYGGLKVLCEGIVEEIFPSRALVVRPGLVAGPYDQTDRVTYWVWRMAQGGEALAPETPTVPVQFIDARDLAAFTLDQVESGGNGVFNATGPVDRLTFGAMLDEFAVVGDANTRVVWASEAFLVDQEVEGWSDMPLWIPGDEELGVLEIDCSKAVAAGLTHRPLAETAADTLAWARTRPEDHDWKAGLTPAREAQLQQLWKAVSQ